MRNKLWRDGIGKLARKVMNSGMPSSDGNGISTEDIYRKSGSNLERKVMQF